MASVALRQDFLHSLFDYDNGLLRWREYKGPRAKKGSIAGSTTNFGYRSIRINHKPTLCHKIVYCMFTGETPKCLDHINGDRSDNRIENLRPATLSENQLNRGMDRRNTSGVKGVSFDKHSGKWYARVNTRGIALRKLFKDIKDAEVWVMRIRTEKHGEYACHGRVASLPHR